jgi:hypothetical protein
MTFGIVLEQAAHTWSVGSSMLKVRKPQISQEFITQKYHCQKAMRAHIVKQHPVGIVFLLFG